MEAEKQMEVTTLKRMAELHGIPVEGLSPLYAEIRKHVELKDAVVEAARNWYPNQHKWQMPIEDGDFLESIKALVEFEAKTK